MPSATLEKLSQDVKEIKVQLHRITHILQEDFELSDEVKKELKESRKQSLSEYIDHKDVLKEFT
ncbi:hypothetical protein HZB03_01425 [Candidatus Woesearchaeota archaeon]|nr:hypothetical protein [Candidatus Woesearchaeota archaeon]